MLYFGATATIIAFLASGLSAHMIEIIAGLGVGAALAAPIAAVRGVGQSAARLVDVLFLARVNPLSLHATALLLLTLSCGLAFLPLRVPGAIVFSAAAGAGLGLTSITRGTVPLLLFGTSTYATRVGRILVPGFLAASVAPIVYALLIEHGGVLGALAVSSAVGALAVVLAGRLSTLAQPGSSISKSPR